MCLLIPISLPPDLPIPIPIPLPFPFQLVARGSECHASESAVERKKKLDTLFDRETERVAHGSELVFCKIGGVVARPHIASVNGAFARRIWSVFLGL